MKTASTISQTVKRMYRWFPARLCPSGGPSLVPVGLLLVLLSIPKAFADPPSTIAYLGPEKVPLQALVNSVTADKDRPYQASDVLGEFPIRRRVYFRQPLKHFNIIVQGMLQSSETGGGYGDVVREWASARKSACTGGVQILNSSLGEVPELKQPYQLLLLHTPEGSSAPSEGVGARPREGSTQPVSAAPDERAEFPGEVSRIPLTVGPKDIYSFRQSRLLKVIDSDKLVYGIQILAGENDERFFGALRVHLAMQVSPELQEDGDINAGRILFNYFGGPGKMKYLGPPIVTRDDKDFPISGDFLFPVGFEVIGDPEHASTSRILSGLPPGQIVRVRVTGIYIFSGYRYSSRGDEARHRHTAGSGGWQDIAFRYDHHKTGVPFIPMMCEYPARARSIPIPLFSSLLKLLDFSLQSLNSNKKDMTVAFPDVASPKHQYQVDIRVPDDGKITFYAKDENASLGNYMTQDNAGLLFVEYLGPVRSKR